MLDRNQLLANRCKNLIWTQIANLTPLTQTDSCIKELENSELNTEKTIKMLVYLIITLKH